MAGRHRDTHRQTHGRHRRPPRRGHAVVPAAAAVLLLCAGGAYASAALTPHGTDADTKPATTNSSAGGSASASAAPVPSTSPGTSASAAATPTPTATKAAPAAHRARPLPAFALTVVGRLSWIRVIGPNGRVLYLGLVRHGHTVTTPAHPLTVTVGNAGAVALVLHHHRHGLVGRPGQVRVLRIP